MVIFHSYVKLPEGTSTESMNLLYLLLFQDYDGTQKQLTECWA